MNFEEYSLRRQSCRDYKKDKVELEKLVKICEVANNAPSSCNGQPWKLYIVSENKEIVDEVRKNCQNLIPNKFLDNVSSFIVVEQTNGNLSSSIGSRFTKNDMHSIDLGLLISHITFEALDLGLDTCIIGAFKSENIVKAMKLDNKKIIRMVIAVGYQTDDYKLRNKIRKTKDQYLEIV